MQSYSPRRPRSNRLGRDHYRKSYGNPLFSVSGRQKRDGGSFFFRNALRIVGATAMVSLVAGVGWYVFWGPSFRITSVDINGASPVAESQLRTILAQKLSVKGIGGIPGSNIFAFNVKSALSDVGQSLYFETIDIRKKMPHTITVQVKEKVGTAVYISDHSFFLIDDSGTIIRSLTDAEIAAIKTLPPDLAAVQVQGLDAQAMDVPTNLQAPAPDPSQATKNSNPLPLIIDKQDPATASPRQVSPGQPAFPPATMNLIFQAYGRLPDVAGTSVKWFSASENGETILATMDGDWNIYLTTSLPFDVQATRLGLVLKEKIGAQKTKLEYIDLRYNERIFYRFKGDTPQPPPSPTTTPVPTSPPTTAAPPKK